MFHMAKEYRSMNRLNVLSLGYDVIIFCWNKTEIDSRFKKLIGPRMPGLANYIEDWRIKFKKFQARDLPAMDVVELKQKFEEAIEMLAQVDAEESLDARGFVRIQKTFRKQLAKARLAEQRQRRKSSLMRCAQLVGAGALSSNESLLLDAIDVVVSFINLIALPITWPLSMAAVAVKTVQDTLKPRKPTNTERAALRNDLIRQLWLLSKTLKDDTEEMRKVSFVLY